MQVGAEKNPQVADPLKDSILECQGLHARMWISNRFPDDISAAGPETIF